MILFKKKVTGFSLLYAVFLLTILLLLLSGMLALSLMSRLEANHYILFNRLERNAYSSINLLLVPEVQFAYYTPYLLSLFDSPTDSVEVVKSRWGLFDLVRVSAFFRVDSISRVAISGDYSKSLDDEALVIADNFKPLCVCGDTYIRGNCVSPQAGVKPAAISGRYYQREELIVGDVLAEEYHMPDLNPLIAQITPGGLLSTYGFFGYPAELEGPVFIDTLVNSFLKLPVVLTAKHGILLENCFLKGNIILVSDSTVRINNSASIEDVIICAKTIRIGDNFNGCGQFIATDSISCGFDSFLNYPSVLAVIHNTDSQQSPYLWIAPRARVFGTVLCYSKNRIASLTSIGEVAGDATVIGTVYANNEICLKGKVHGSVHTTGFILRTPVSIYENYLVDTEIDYTKLPEEYVGVSYSANTTLRKVIKWLE